MPDDFDAVRDLRGCKNLWASVIMLAIIEKDYWYLFDDNRIFPGSFIWICHHLDLDFINIRRELRIVWKTISYIHGRITDYENITRIISK